MWDIQYKYHISEIALPTKQTLVPKVMDVMGVKLPPPPLREFHTYQNIIINHEDCRVP